MTSCVVVGVAGASGSGKTRLAANLDRQIAQQHGESSVGVICEDFYYKDQSHLSFNDRLDTNYDHPDSMDHTLLIEQLRQLKRGETVELPQYDYTQHTRATHTVPFPPKKVIIVEGILLFSDETLRGELDYLIFVDTPLDICFIRRVERDMKERGRTFESVARQYESTVRPMYLAFVEPSKYWADIIVPSWRENDTAVRMLHTKLCEHLL